MEQPDDDESYFKKLLYIQLIDRTYIRHALEKSSSCQFLIHDI